MEDLRWACGAWTRLGRAAVLRAALGVLVVLASGTLGVSPALAKTSPYLKEDRNLVDVYAAVEGAKLGVVLPGGPEKFITIKESSENLIKSGGGTALAETTCLDKNGVQEGPAVGCVIELAVLPHKNGELRDTIIHEVFHVFESVMSGTLANFHSAPHKDWLIEGAAAWAESDLRHSDNGARQEWRNYLRSPSTPLFNRSGTSGALSGYSAVGFFGHMDAEHKSPWTRFRAMFAAKGSAAAYAAAGVDVPFLQDEASVFFREPKFGSEWDQTGPNVPSAHEVGFKPAQVSVTSKATVPLVVKPYADGAYDLTITGLPASQPVLELTVVRGNVRIHSTSGGSVNEVDPHELLLCSNLTVCSCPRQPNRYLQFQKGDLAITGGPTGGEVRLTPREPCEKLLPGINCTALLPGFVQFIQAVEAKPTSVESRQPDGTVSYACAFLERGRNVVGPEGEEFEGLIAPVVSVLRASTVAGAVKYFELMSNPVPHFQSTRLRIGDEAVLRTVKGISAKGQPEDGSSAIVRVHNVVANYALFGTPGNIEASPEASLGLLVIVAGRL